MPVKQSNIIKISGYKVHIIFEFKKMTFVLFLRDTGLII